MRRFSSCAQVLARQRERNFKRDSVYLSADYSIGKVIVEHEADELVATVACEASQAGQFAFYAFRNGERIHTQWYSSNPAMRFRIHTEPGLYRVLVFFLSPNGSRTTKYLNPVFLYSAAHAPARIIRDGSSRS
jgi:hypothetical protein